MVIMLICCDEKKLSFTCDEHDRTGKTHQAKKLSCYHFCIGESYVHIGSDGNVVARHPCFQMTPIDMNDVYMASIFFGAIFFLLCIII